MYKKIQEWATNHSINAIRPTYAWVSLSFYLIHLLSFYRWSAVVRGAVVKGLQGDTNVVATRKNRRHYGTAISTTFDPRKHRESDSFIDKYDGRKLAGCQIDWLLKQGRDLPTSGTAHAKISIRAAFWLDEKRECYLELRASNNTKAPKRSVDSVCTSTFGFTHCTDT